MQDSPKALGAAKDDYDHIARNSLLAASAVAFIFCQRRNNMNTKTVSAFVSAPPNRVYEFASNPCNLPQWAPSFCHSVERIGEKWIVQSPVEPVVFAFVPANDFGILDHTITFPSGLTLTNPMRVIHNGNGSEVLFTVIQREGMSEQQFQEDAGLVLRDLYTLRRLLEPSCA